MANLRDEHLFLGGDKRQGGRWGTEKDVKEVDERRRKEEEQAKEKFGKLFGRAQDDKRRPVATYLLIRYSLTDQGVRSIPTGTPFWISPDIWVETADPLGKPVVGQPNFVHARVLNLGAFDAAPVKVDFYWGDPSLGLGGAHMNLIGTEYVEVKSLQSKDVRCNTAWVPTWLNNGHECLKVHCSCWTMGDVVEQPFNSILDRHVGQRNVEVVMAPAGKVVKFSVYLNNLFAADSETEVLAQIYHVAINDALRAKVAPAQLVQKLALFGVIEQRDLNVARRAHGAAFLNAELTSHSRFYQLQMLETGATFRQAHTGARFTCRETEGGGEQQMVRLKEVMLRAGEQRQLEVEIGVPSSARPCEAIVCHLFQVLRGQTVGGYTAVVLVAES